MNKYFRGYMEKGMKEYTLTIISIDELGEKIEKTTKNVEYIWKSEEHKEAMVYPPENDPMNLYGKWASIEEVNVIENTYGIRAICPEARTGDIVVTKKGHTLINTGKEFITSESYLKENPKYQVGDKITAYLTGSLLIEY